MRNLILTLALLLPTQASADNPIDWPVAKVLQWNDTSTAAKSSDALLATHVVGTLAYTALHNDQERKQKLFAVGGAYVGNFAINQLVKHLVGRTRPDGSDDQSFYSGHTSTAFVGAGAICAQSRGFECTAALALAGTVGYLRMAAGKHYLSDVAVGAGAGYAFGRFVPTIFVTF